MAKLHKPQEWTRLERVLKSAAVAVQGEVACIDVADSGALVPAAVSETLIPIGVFESSATGDGTATIFVRLFKTVDIYPLVNSGTGSVTDAHVGQVCYLHSATSEVSMTATGKSVAGRVWGISGSGAGATVFVETAISMGIQGLPGEDA